MAAKMIARTTAQQLRTFAVGLAARGCSRNAVAFNVKKYCSTPEKPQTKVDKMIQDPEYVKALERFKDISDPNKNWFWHGYNPYNRDLDTFWHHQIMFLCIAGVVLGSTFILAYMPDNKLHDWKQREAYLELHRRESNGLPLIDPNLVPPEKMMNYLPTDDELGDTEIII